MKLISCHIDGFGAISNRDYSFDKGLTGILGVNRIPVGMHVERAHKDAYLQALVVKMVVFFGRFYHHHLAVAGRDDEVRVIYLQNTHRVAEEIGDKHQQRCCQNQRHGKYPAWLVDEDRYVNRKQQETQQDNDVAALLVNL